MIGNVCIGNINIIRNRKLRSIGRRTFPRGEVPIFSSIVRIRSRVLSPLKSLLRCSTYLLHNSPSSGKAKVQVSCQQWLRWSRSKTPCHHLLDSTTSFWRVKTAVISVLKKHHFNSSRCKLLTCIHVVN